MQLSFREVHVTSVRGFGGRVAQERRLKAARDRRDIGQDDVAEAVEATPPTVSRWEAGLTVPGDKKMERLAKYFGVTPAWLRYGQEPREAPEKTSLDPRAKEQSADKKKPA
jgi:transcriptional regulator with XRE-family HTH domain